MINRRRFLAVGALGTAGLATGCVDTVDPSAPVTLTGPPSAGGGPGTAAVDAAAAIEAPALHLHVVRDVSEGHPVFDATGGRYQVVSRDHRVAAYDSAGIVRFELADWGVGPAQINGPASAVASGDVLYVADLGNHRIQMFSLDGEHLGAATGAMDGEQLLRPRDVVYDGSDWLYIADTGNDRVAIIDRVGRWVGQIGESGQGAEHFDSPYALALSADGRLFVADRGNQRISVVDLSGRHLYSFRELGDFEPLRDPVSLAITPDQRVIVAERATGRLAAFDLDGQPLEVIDVTHPDAGRGMPTHVSVSGDGSVFISAIAAPHLDPSSGGQDV